MSQKKTSFGRFFSLRDIEMGEVTVMPKED